MPNSNFPGSTFLRHTQYFKQLIILKKTLPIFKQPFFSEKKITNYFYCFTNQLRLQAYSRQSTNKILVLWRFLKNHVWTFWPPPPLVLEGLLASSWSCTRRWQECCRLILSRSRPHSCTIPGTNWTTARSAPNECQDTAPPSLHNVRQGEASHSGPAHHGLHPLQGMTKQGHWGGPTQGDCLLLISFCGGTMKQGRTYSPQNCCGRF